MPAGRFERHRGQLEPAARGDDAGARPRQHGHEVHHLRTSHAEQRVDIEGPTIEMMDLERTTDGACVGQVGEASGRQVIDHVDLVLFGQQAIDEVGSDESRTADHQHSHVDPVTRAESPEPPRRVALSPSAT